MTKVFDLFLADQIKADQSKWHSRYLFVVGNNLIPEVQFDEKVVLNRAVLLLKFKEESRAQQVVNIPWYKIVDRADLFHGREAERIDVISGGEFNFTHNLTMRFGTNSPNYLAEKDCVAVHLPFEFTRHQALDFENPHFLSSFKKSFSIVLGIDGHNNRYGLIDVSLKLECSVVKLPARRHVFETSVHNYDPVLSLKIGATDTYSLPVHYDIPCRAAIRFIYISLFEEVDNFDEATEFPFKIYDGPVTVTLKAPTLFGSTVYTMECSREAWEKALCEQEDAKISAEKLSNARVFVHSFSKTAARRHAKDIMDEKMTIDIQFLNGKLPQLATEAKIAYDLFEKKQDE